MKRFHFDYHEFQSADGLDPISAALLRVAREVIASAYAPYSHFHVGAAVLMENGDIVKGVNVENASYPVGICAERTALASAIANHPELKITTIAISYGKEGLTSQEPAFPCGMCRQFISECEDRNKAPIRIILSGQVGPVVLIDSAKHLLPFGFDGKSLE